LNSIAGLLLGGAIIGAVEGVGPAKVSAGLAQIAVPGLSVGIGTKLRSIPGFSRQTRTSIISV